MILSFIRTSPNPEAASVEADKADTDAEAEADTSSEQKDANDKESDKDQSLDNNEDNDKNTDIDKDKSEEGDKASDEQTGSHCPSPNPEQREDDCGEMTVNDNNKDTSETETAADDNKTVVDTLEPPQHQVRVEQSNNNNDNNNDESEQQQPENLHLSPPDQGQSPGDSPTAHPLNLHQSPEHSDTPTHPFHRPTPTNTGSYHPGIESAAHFSSAYQSYNHHYFSNANNNYNNQFSGFPHTVHEQHEMYMAAAGRALDPHHPGHGLAGLGALSSHFSRPSPGQDPYNFPNSDDEHCSPTRGSNPLQMGFSGMPMPLIAPKAQKPRKPRKPKSPKPDPSLMSMPIKEDSRG